ncbi:hypothetical protein [Dokdonella sp.]|uniref:hypothetical protein n=1 Tax=Dokdonella sp. TaxID=2291710 RepID=UPI0037838968
MDVPEHIDVPEQTVWTEVGAYFNLPIRWDLLTRVSPEEAERFANDMDDLEQRRRSLHAQMVMRSDRFLRLIRESAAVTPKET